MKVIVKNFLAVSGK